MLSTKKLKTISLLSLLALSTHCDAKKLTTYVTEWSGYGSEKYAPYPFDGAYLNGWHNLNKSSNPDMVAKANLSDVLVYSFIQVWNPTSKQGKQFNVPADWAGNLHFDDVWGNLPNRVAAEYPTWKNFCSIAPNGACAAIQQDCRTSPCHLNLLNYNELDIGQLNNFAAFLNLKTSAIKAIAIGGANTVENQSMGYDSFQAIFANQNAFLNSLAAWVKNAPGLNGIDYDFEPPIHEDGSQQDPDSTTSKDYANFFELVKNTRAKLGADAYISVTITANEHYLDYINRSVEGGWFKKIAPYVNAVNVMTYDMHGPWSKKSDPGAISHAMLENPGFIDFSQYDINYADVDVTSLVLSYGLPADKLQIGLAAYGRGFASVEAGNNGQYPGFGQPWSGVSKFPGQFTLQDGLLPYKFVQAALTGQTGAHYQNYDVVQNDRVIASYIYSPEAKQLVGYMSPALVKSLCQFDKDDGLQGAILWSMDTDANDADQGVSLIKTYSNACR